jgi:calcineurin-like phosphoesterase family protein
MSRIFYTSDVHVAGHRLVAALRGHVVRPAVPGENIRDIADTASHDAWLADVWDSQVKPGDTVFLLGDVSVSGSQAALDWIAARPGTKHLIAGNHDPVHPMHSSYLQKMPVWSQYFATIQPFLRRKLLNTTVLLSHFPYAEWGDGPERAGNRYEQYRLPDEGNLLLHGHTHGKEREHGHSLHVGIDAWGKLVSQEIVIGWVNDQIKARA